MKTNIIITLWMTLFCNAFAAEPNRTDMTALKLLTDNWLKDVVVTQADKPYHSLRYRFPVKWYPDNSWVTIYDPPKRAINYIEFVDIARQWAGEPNRPSGYYVCPRNYDKLYHLPYPKCDATRGNHMVAILAKNMGQYVPCPVCLPKPPEPNEPTLEEVLAGVDDPNLIEAIREMMEKQ